jgi:predicted esterase YcpF (UPF0227 family)
MITHLLYLHGFRSSPKSFKAQYLAGLIQRDFPKVQWSCPQLPPSPKGASELILDITKYWPAQTSAVIGSSLGGFYANWLARIKGFRSVLINPASYPARDLEKHIGEQTNWQSPEESFFFKKEYLDELLSLYPNAFDGKLKFDELKALKEQQLVMACTGDEVLDWNEMIKAHPNSEHYVVEGSDHAMSDFDKHAPYALRFLKILDF